MITRVASRADRGEKGLGAERGAQQDGAQQCGAAEGTATNRVRVTVNRGLVAFALVWQGAWFAADPALWPMNQASAVSAVLITGVLVTIPCIVITTWGRWASPSWAQRMAWVNIALLALASCAMLSVDVIDISNDWVAGASLVNLSVAAAGLFLPARIGIPAIAFIIIGEFVILTGRSGLGVEAPSLMSDALYAAYALAIGSAAAGSRFALERSTVRAEQARASIDVAESAAQRIQARTDRLLEQEIKVHETALNTLTAIGRGGISGEVSMQHRIQVRADEAGRVLSALARADSEDPFESMSGSGRASVFDLSQSIEDLRIAGIDVRIAGRFPDAMPQQVQGAFTAAMREALSNTARHAHATSVRIRISRGSWRHGSMRVRVVISDDGRGFSPESVAGGFGIQRAIEGSLRRVGGHAEVSSAPDRGTRVEMEWPASAGETPRDSSYLVSTVRSVAGPALFAIWVFSALSLLTTVGSVENPALDLLAFGAYSAMVAVVVHQARFGFLRWPVVVVMAVAAPLVYRMQDAALGSVPQDPWNEWSSEALVAIMFVVAATGPLWAWAVVLGSWLITQGDVVTELTQPGTAVIAAGAILGFSLHRSVRDYHLRLEELVIAQRSVDSTLADAQSLALRYASVASSGVLELLERVAEGSADPSSPEVREACTLHERHIRSLMRMDPARRDFDAALVALSDHACTRGVLLDVVVPEGLPDIGGAVLRSNPGPFELVDMMERGATARLSAHIDGDRIALRCVGACPGVTSIGASTFPGGDIVMVDQETATCMWEVVVDASGDRG